MANETLADAIDWTTYAVLGDEGPWSTIAINRMLGRARASVLTGTLRVVPVAHPLATKAGTLTGELLHPVTSQVVQRFVAA